MKLAAACNAVLVFAFATTAGAESRFVLAIGNNVGLGSDAPLRWAERDAERFSEAFVQLGQVDKDRVTVVLGQDAERARLELGRIRGRIEETRRRGERTVLFLYYSGHADKQALRLAGGELPLSEIQQWVRGAGASVTVTVIDACHSGALIRGRGKGLSDDPGFEVSYVREPDLEGHVTITSAGPGEVAQESDDLQSSYFTHHLISGMRGVADGDRDGRVTLSELYSHVYNQTLRRSYGTRSATQHPMAEIDVSGEGSLVVTVPARSEATLVLSREIFGNILVIRARSGRVVAEVEKQTDVGVPIAVMSGRYRVLVRTPDELLVADVDLPWGGTLELEPGVFRARELISALEKGPGPPAMWVVAGGAGLGQPTSSLSSRAVFPTLVAERSIGRRLLGRGAVRWSRYSGDNALWLFEHDEIEIEAGFGGMLEPGPIDLVAWAGAVCDFVHQRGDRRDADVVAPFAPRKAETTRWALGFGPTVGGELRVRLLSGWHAGLELEARGIWTRDTTSIVLKPRARATLLVGYAVQR